MLTSNIFDHIIKYNLYNKFPNLMHYSVNTGIINLSNKISNNLYYLSKAPYSSISNQGINSNKLNNNISEIVKTAISNYKDYKNITITEIDPKKNLYDKPTQECFNNLMTAFSNRNACQIIPVQVLYTDENSKSNSKIIFFVAEAHFNEYHMDNKDQYLQAIKMLSKFVSEKEKKCLILTEENPKPSYSPMHIMTILLNKKQEIPNIKIEFIEPNAEQELIKFVLNHKEDSSYKEVIDFLKQHNITIENCNIKFQKDESLKEEFYHKFYIHTYDEFNRIVNKGLTEIAHEIREGVMLKNILSNLFLNKYNMIVACLGYEHVENICKKLGILNISQKLA